jgi:hypothetical protein
MFDPVTIGVAFVTAQKTVGYIKQAVAQGKEVNSLFYNSVAITPRDKLNTRDIVFKQVIL